MLCAKPITVGNRLVPCRQCMPCRINHKRLWASKILLEVIGLGPSSFVTLTYAPEHLPEGGTLVKEDIYAYKNRLRQEYYRTTGRNLRFFVVGEYGDKFGRPHYHMALFGLCPEKWENFIRRHWKLGFVHVGELRKESALYLAHYTTKKLAKTGSTSNDFFCYLPGILPEFASSSRNPALGTSGALHLVDIYRTQAGKRALEAFRVSGSYDFQGKSWPVPKLHKKLILTQLGLDDQTIHPDVEKYPDLPNFTDLPMTRGVNREDQAEKARRRHERAVKARTF